MHQVPAWVELGAARRRWLLGFAARLPVSTSLRAGAAGASCAGAARPLYRFLLNKWYFDELYDFIFVRPAMWLGTLSCGSSGDGGIIDGLARTASPSASCSMSPAASVRLQTGYLYHYAFAMLIGVALLVTWLMFCGGAAR